MKLQTPYINLNLSRNLLFILLVLIIFISCDPNRVYEKNVRINHEGWSAGEKVKFDVPIDDSIQLHNFYINLRHTEDYQFSNLYLFIDTEFPEGTQARDTIELILADNTGQWYGKGLGKIKEYQVMIRRAVVFPVTGIYTISITQGMREEILEGIEDVGIRIETMSQE